MKKEINRLLVAAAVINQTLSELSPEEQERLLLGIIAEIGRNKVGELGLYDSDWRKYLSDSNNIFQ